MMYSSHTGTHASPRPPAPSTDNTPTPTLSHDPLPTLDIHTNNHAMTRTPFSNIDTRPYATPPLPLSQTFGHLSHHPHFYPSYTYTHPHLHTHLTYAHPARATLSFSRTQTHGPVHPNTYTPLIPNRHYTFIPMQTHSHTQRTQVKYLSHLMPVFTFTDPRILLPFTRFSSHLGFFCL